LEETEGLSGFAQTPLPTLPAPCPWTEVQRLYDVLRLRMTKGRRGKVWWIDHGKRHEKRSEREDTMKEGLLKGRDEMKKGGMR